MDWGWLIWLAFALVFVVIEVFTLDLLFAMLGVGALAGMVVELSHGWFWLQIVVAAVVAVLLIFTLRPPLLRRLRQNASVVQHNIDAITGLAGLVETAGGDAPGTVKLENGETWSAKPLPDSPPLSPGDRITVVRVVGATVEVAPRTEGAHDRAAKEN